MCARRVKLYDPTTGALNAFPGLTPGTADAHPLVQTPVKMIARARSGALLALCVGNSASDNPHGGKLDSAAAAGPGPAPVLYSADAGVSWSAVEGFPAGVSCPPGVNESEWDDDGDREGRHLCPLADGRMLCTWVVAGDRTSPSTGIHYNISLDDGRTWDPCRTVIVLPELAVVGRYYSPRTVQLGEGGKQLGTVFVRGPQESMESISYVRVPLALIDNDTTARVRGR